jgi:superfamily II DNA or RNA helicase
MLTALPLYPHQADALDALTGKERELISFPTGGGKGVMIAHTALRAISADPSKRVLVGVHTEELVGQLHKTISDVCPHLDVGMVRAQAHDDVTAQVIVFSVQTMRNPKRRARVTDVGTLIWDEAHHCVSPTYRTITEHYAGATLVGFTATPERGDGQSLAGAWDRVAYSRDVSWMVRRGWLIPPLGRAVEVPDLDLRTVKRSGGDYRGQDLGEALAGSLAPGIVAKAWLEHASDRKTIAFFPTVGSCYVFAEAFQDAGVDARVVHGGLPPAERKQILADHRAGVFPVLVNCMVLTEGYNDPTIGCVLMGRPTRSRPLHMQIVGRGLRVDPGRPYAEQDCLLLYVVGNAPIPELRTMADISDRAIEMREGRTLTELEDEFDAGQGVAPDGPVYYHGEVVTRDFDPLARKSSKVWIRTRGGSYFVPAGKHAYVFICEYPEPGRWSVAWCGAYASIRLAAGTDAVPRPHPEGRSVGMTAHRGLPLDQAMVWAEDLAVDMGADTMVLANKRAAWRRGMPTEKTISFAKTLGIEPGEQEKAGALSDRIGVYLGSQRIDPLVQKVRNA